MAGRAEELMISISGVRGRVGRVFTPRVVFEYARAFGEELKPGSSVILGRDSRPSGPWVVDLASSVLRAQGHDVTVVGLCSTPTLGYAIRGCRAAGGIMATASHNGAEWNALKLFGADGGFLAPAMVDRVYRRAGAVSGPSTFVQHPATGRRTENPDLASLHLDALLKLVPYRRGQTRFKVVLDTVNGAGCVLVPEFLRRLGCTVVTINASPTGRFAHAPEPLPENLGALGRAVRRSRADFGVAVDPDADRVAFVDEHGNPIGEELSLAIATAFVMDWKPGPVVVNLSTSRVSEELARAAGQKFYRTPVGEAHVAAKMRKVNAAIGGEGNGGVIYPRLHPGRDALAGIAFLLGQLRRRREPLSVLVRRLPRWCLVRGGMPVPDDYDARLRRLISRLPPGRVDRRDGIRVDWPHGWVQMRRSNTEPIVRILAETRSEGLSRELLNETVALLGGRNVEAVSGSRKAKR
jgi:phosphomannomutase